MFLTQQELYEASARKKPSAQIRWLKSQGLPFRIDADGRPRVTLADYYARPGQHQPKEPQLNLTG